ncbi:MAG: MIP/aquaporin family protein [Beutenbergiaceae bacterium]
MRKYVVEFIGTFFLVFTVVATVLTDQALAPLAIGASLMVMIYAGGHISGGHFNPAVSTAALVRGGFAGIDLLGYWAAQLAGGVAGALLASYAVGSSGSAEALSGAAIVPALLVEFLFTFALAWVVLNVATSKDTEGNSFYGLAIGFTVVVGAIAVGGISGGAFNPAVAFGASFAGLFAWSNIWIFLVANLLGGAVAGLAFKALSANDAAEAS